MVIAISEGLHPLPRQQMQWGLGGQGSRVGSAISVGGLVDVGAGDGDEGKGYGMADALG